MTVRSSSGSDALDPLKVEISFSEGVQSAFRSLAVIAEKSTHFDMGSYETLKSWSQSSPVDLHSFVICLPAIAGDVAEHVSVTHDTAAKEAWLQLTIQLAEADGFSVLKTRQRSR